jgi:formamidopyrimidine-DNA glycosylase
LLMQPMFPGVGNWMADEILWRARIDPRQLCGSLPRRRVNALWRATRAVCHGALRSIGAGASDPPASWLFHQRWKRAGHCPRDGRRLAAAEIGGRTTRWCRRCQH